MVEPIIVLFGNLILPYFVLSVVALLLIEVVARVAHERAKLLERSIADMLDDPGSAGITRLVYNHPLIAPLHVRGHKPDYIPNRLFALALVDAVKSTSDVDFRPAVRSLGNERLRRGLEALTRYSPAGLEIVAIETWFDGVMDAAGGVYRWPTVAIGAWVAAALVLVLNFDAIRISNHTAQRSVIEKVLETRVEALARIDTTSANRTVALSLMEEGGLDALVYFPIGWTTELRSRHFHRLTQEHRVFEWVVTKIIGLLGSVLVIILLAPLIFDLLNKITVVRMTVKPYRATFSEVPIEHLNVANWSQKADAEDP